MPGLPTPREDWPKGEVTRAGLFLDRIQPGRTHPGTTHPGTTHPGKIVLGQDSTRQDCLQARLTQARLSWSRHIPSIRGKEHRARSTVTDVPSPGINNAYLTPIPGKQPTRTSPSSSGQSLLITTLLFPIDNHRNLTLTKFVPLVRSPTKTEKVVVCSVESFRASTRLAYLDTFASNNDPDTPNVMSPQSDASSTSPAAFPASAPSAERASLSPAQKQEILQLAARIAVLGRDHMSFLLGNTAARTSAPMRDAQLNALISAAIATTTSLSRRDNSDTRTRTQSRDKIASTRSEDSSS